MTLSLNTIKPSKNSTKKRIRVGRGNSSGKGTYSGKGLKGQKSRSGVSGLKRLGMKQVLLRTPKKRGFKSLEEKNAVINLVQLNSSFSDGDIVNSTLLVKKKMLDSVKTSVKILGKGNLKVKNLKIQNIQVSQAAKAQIEKNGGKIIYKK